eukprot:1159282-Pelagomonas_calceolata.AAC.18
MKAKGTQLVHVTFQLPSNGHSLAFQVDSAKWFTNPCRGLLLCEWHFPDAREFALRSIKCIRHVVLNIPGARCAKMAGPTKTNATPTQHVASTA